MAFVSDKFILIDNFDFALEVGFYFVKKLLNVYDCIESNIDSNESKIPPEGSEGRSTGLDSERSTRAGET